MIGRVGPTGSMSFWLTNNIDPSSHGIWIVLQGSFGGCWPGRRPRDGGEHGARLLLTSGVLDLVSYLFRALLYICAYVHIYTYTHIYINIDTYVYARKYILRAISQRRA